MALCVSPGDDRAERGSPAPRIPGGPGSPRLPRAVAAPLGCLPGVAAAVALVLTAYGVERAAETSDAEAAARPAPAFQAPRPSIVPRSVWLGDAARDQPPPRYDDQVVAVFVHHTDSPNGYDCADAPGIIRGLYDGQTEGARLGRPRLQLRRRPLRHRLRGPRGRHRPPRHRRPTQGFNHRTAGIAALGTFTEGVEVPEVMLRAIAAVTAWKLGPSGTDPRAEVRLVSSNGGSRYAAGTAATLPAVAGHSDGYMTDCPGAALHARLPEIRDLAARLQGRDAGTGTDRDTGTDTERVALEDDARNEELSP